MPALHRKVQNAKRAAEATLLEEWVPPSKENDHPAVPVVMMVVVVVVVVLGGGEVRVGADSAGERAGGDENGDEA